MFTLACEQVLNFLGKEMSANQNAHTTFSHVKNIVRPIKALIRLFSHVKNIVCSEIRILFQPNTSRKSLYSYIIKLNISKKNTVTKILPKKLYSDFK